MTQNWAKLRSKALPQYIMILNVSVLERTFNLIEPRATELASSFYENLFTDCPEARSLFANTDMEKQKKKLIMSLVYVVGNLRYPDHLSATLKDLGAKHVTYGAMREHYPIVGAALLKTLETYLGSHWTPEVQQSWTDAYHEIARIMLEGAKEHELSLEFSQLNQQTVPTKTTRVGWSMKYVLAICGIIGALLVGFWMYTNQGSNDPSTSPAKTNSLRP